VTPDEEQRLAVLEGVLRRWDATVIDARLALEHAEAMREKARHALQTYEEEHD
jgi:hypothetical protein